MSEEFITARPSDSVHDDNGLTKISLPLMVTTTRVLGLKGALLHENNLARINSLVSEVSEIRFHTYGLLSVYANIVAHEGTINGEVFSQTLVDQAMAICRFPDKLNPNAPDALRMAAEQYFSGPLLDVCRTRAFSGLLHIDIVQAERVQIVTAFKNCLDFSTYKIQKQGIQQLYGLTTKEAKLVVGNLNTSVEKRLEIALEAHVKRYKRVALRKRDELDHAIRNGLGTVDALNREFIQLEKDIALQLQQAKADPELAYTSLREDNKMDKPRTRQSGLIGPLLPLSVIFERELLLLPPTQSQSDQLTYRFKMLERLENEGHEKLFNLVPTTSFSRSFVFLTKSPFANLVPPQEGKKRKPDYTDMNDLMPMVFKMDKFKRMLKSGSLCFGDSIRTDGIQLQVQLVDNANRESKARKIEARKQTNLLKKEAAAKGVAFVKPKPPKKPPNVKLPKPKNEIKADIVLPPGAILVGGDTGLKNVGGFVSEEDMDNPYTISTTTVYHESGMKLRQQELAKAEATERLYNPAFAEASDAVSSARTKTSDFEGLLAALHTRGLHYRTLYGFYGSEGLARHRFLNYQGKQRVLTKMVHRVLPTNNHILICGDADFGSTRKGIPAGFAGKFVKKCQELRTVIFADEFRSSMLDSNTHQMMHHPPKEMGVSKYGKPYLRRVYGLYQSSASGYTYLWNRDENAARNILLNFKYKYAHGTMPAPFQRGTELTKPLSCTYKYSAKESGGFSRWHEPLILADPEAKDIDL